MKTRYPAKLSTRVSLFFALSIFLSGTIFLICQFYISHLQLERLEDVSSLSLRRLSGENYEVHVNDIGVYASDFFRTLTSENSLLVANLIAKYPDIKPQDIEGLRDLATKQIYLGNTSVGYFTLVNTEGLIICSYNKEKYEGKNIRDFLSKELFLEKFNYKFDRSMMISSFEKLINDEKNQKRYFITSKKVEGTDLWLLGFVNLSKAEEPIYKNYIKTEESILTSIIEQLDNEFTKGWIIAFTVLFGIIAFLSVSFALIGLYLAKLLTRPIIKLRDAVQLISNGNFDTKVSESGTVETIHLARTFNHLGDRLKAYMQNLKEETSMIEAVRTELRIARKIQTSILPVLTDDFNNNYLGLSLFFMPAKDVSGDFYDFFYLDEAKEKLIIILGDVSGKGAPAALFMCVIKTILRGYAKNFTSLPPGEILTKANDEISQHNPEEMFATVFFISYETKTGVISYANAGHHASLLLSRNNKTITRTGKSDEPLLGIFNEYQYSTGTMNLAPSDMLICYTDGLTDAMSETGESFGVGRLCSLIEQNMEKPADDIIGLISSQVLEYQKNNLFDDITLLSLSRYGENGDANG